MCNWEEEYNTVSELNRDKRKRLKSFEVELEKLSAALRSQNLHHWAAEVDRIRFKDTALSNEKVLEVLAEKGLSG